MHFKDKIAYLFFLERRHSEAKILNKFYYNLSYEIDLTSVIKALNKSNLKIKVIRFGKRYLYY